MAEITDDDASKRLVPSTPDKAASSTPNETGESSSNAVIRVGGQRPQECFALLEGIFQDPINGKHLPMDIEITRLPALLGRNTDSDKNNPFFFSLGKSKAFSRKHCTIYYRDKEGGRAEWDESEQKLAYKDFETVKKERGAQPTLKPNPHNIDGGIPSNGFFVLECLGKNRIVVDKVKVEKGESIVLRSGSAIRISAYMLYFLLPTDVEPTPHKIEIPAEKPAASKSTKKKPKAAASKKRPASTTASKKSKKSKKYNFDVPTTSIPIPELEKIPEAELMERIDEAVTKGYWDRRFHFIGTIICNNAVLYAGSSPEIKKIAKEEDGISRSDLMEWVSKSDKYGTWVQQMLTNMEQRSYQAAFTKCLIKSGYERKSGVGRYIKWELPSKLPAWKGKEKKLLTGDRKANNPKPKSSKPKAKKEDAEDEKSVNETEMKKEDETEQAPQQNDENLPEEKSDGGGDNELPMEEIKDNEDEGSKNDENEEDEEGGGEEGIGENEDEENNADADEEQASENAEGDNDEVVI